ncbi:HdeD family acid-resistance protein [Kitasatospora sp. NPDC059571]|uniref:HdeD family acid-resistance protein n=1 Tax=Kitasatospora sp. NPDC059571 TaxID=3346871 RepID=UPI00369A8802
MTTPTTPTSPLTTEPEDLLAAIGRSWRWPLGFGIVTVLAGIIMLSWPEETVRVVAIIIGLQLLVAGVVRFVTAFTHERSSGSRALYVLLSLLSVLAGVLVLRHQLQTIGLLTLIVGAYWLLAGIVTLFVAIGDRGLPGRGFAIFFGLLGVVAGVLVLAYPVQSAIALARLLGLWLILLGLFEVGMAFVLRSAGRRRIPAAR